MNVTARFLALFALALVIASLGIDAKAQTAQPGVIYEKVFKKLGTKPEIFKDSFAVLNPDSDYFLSITALDKRATLSTVLINGKAVANIVSPSIFQRHLIKLNVLPSNSLELRISGAKSSSILVKVFQMSSFSPIFGPEAFIKDKKLVSRYTRSFDVIDIQSQHLLLVEANSSAIKDKNLATIKLNEKVIANPIDFIFDKKGRFFKTISVQEKNKLEISLIGKENSGIKVSILSPSEEELPSPGVLSLVSLKPDTFNPAGANVVIKLDGAFFPTESPAVTIVYNNEVLSDENFSVTANQIVIPNALIPGENKIEIIAFDSDGGSLSLAETLWAGNINVAVDVFGSEGLVPDAEVTATLSDDKKVIVQGRTNAQGRFQLSNVPPRTIFYSAQSGTRLATYGEVSDENYFVFLDLKDPMEPGEPTNLDFSQGLEGWNISNPEAVTIVPHIEDSISEPAVSAKSALMSMPHSPVDISKMTFEQRKAYRKSLPTESPKASMSAAKASGFVFDERPDMNLSTSGLLTPVTAGCMIKVGQNVSMIKVRYKFITSEIPGGYYGSEFNDRFSLYMSTNVLGNARMVTNSMNGFSINAFNEQGATVWRELSLPISPGVSYVSIVAEVQNVGDELFDAQLIIDSIDQNSFGIVGAELFDIDGALLKNLSVAWNNPHMSGNTIINGSVLLRGEIDDQLTGLYVGIIQNGQQVAYANIAPDKQHLLARFESGSVLHLPQKMYALSNPFAQSVALDKNSSLELVIRAFNSVGQMSSYAIERSVKLLTRSKTLTDAQRFGKKDPEVGGDDWGTPECVATADALISSFTSMNFKVNDYSNMNGGTFVPHVAHENGSDFDFWINGLAANRLPNALDAQRVLQIARSNSNINLIGVTYATKDGQAFYDAIKNELINGVPATAIIRNWPKHSDHFHIRCKR